MQIYFACSITGGRDDEPVYQLIVETLLADGHVVPTAILARPEVVALEAISDARAIYERDVLWIRESDVLVAEISTPSHGVGYEIGYALGLGKRVLCLYREEMKVSKMISGNPDPNLTVRSYKNPVVGIEILRGFLNS